MILFRRMASVVVALGFALLAVLIQQAGAQQGGGSGEQFTVDFELRVEGEPPTDAAFSGALPFADGKLTDPDGDGVYTGSASFPASYVDSATRDGLSDSPVPVAIYGGTGRTPSGKPAEPFPGTSDGLLVVDFGAQVIEDGQTFSGDYSFAEGDDDADEPAVRDFVGERLLGSFGEDLLRGADGHDLIVAEAGADALYGVEGDDALYAAYDVPAELAPDAPASHDLLYGGQGDDFIDAADAKGAFDVVYCGPGDDLLVADTEDFVAGDCEVIRRL